MSLSDSPNLAWMETHPTQLGVYRCIHPAARRECTTNFYWTIKYRNQRGSGFLKHTNDINTPDRDGITALHLASMISPYLVKKLLASGADPTQTTRDGIDVLHLAARARQSDIVGMLTVALTIQGKNLQENQVNATDDSGRTPLH
jgi:hypothetical protein